MMRWAAAAILFAMLAAAPASASSRLDFNRGWLFRTDPGLTGETSGWTRIIPTGTLSVSVPHTWNIGEFHDYVGLAWYFRRFEMPPPAPGTHVELHFGATFYKARIWLNGAEVGAHEGGFTAYAFDITAQLRHTNLLVVQIENRPGPASIPGYGARGEPTAWYDWWPYGGIVRDVWLTETGPAWIDRQSIRSELNKERAVIRDHVFLRSERKAAAVVRVTAYEPDNRPAATASLPVALVAGKADITLSLNLPNPKLWSIDRPAVYRMEVELLDGRGKVLDESSDTFGLRTVEIKDRHLYLNGERVRLTGLARHEDSPWEGLAETRGTMRRDFDDMKALHATLTRPVHYPQNPYILDYADRHGIMLIPEIPVWQFSEAQLANPEVLALAKQQMQEMIEQAGNHPSIFAWSVANESATGTPGGIAYFRSMREFIRKLDPGRYVSFADDNLAKLDRAEQSAANDADFLMMNQYYGTWHGPTSALIPALDKVDQMFPSKMVVISEFGYPGFFASSPSEADPARIRTIQEQMPLLAGRDWIAGAIQWCYQDYKSRRNLWPGQTEGYVEHGVVDETRQRKPSYDVWRELNEPARIEAQWVGAANSAILGFAVTLRPNTPQQLPYYPLHHYTLVWKLVGDKGKLVAGGDHLYEDLLREERVTGSVPAGGPAQALRLSLNLLSPTGAVAAERTLNWPAAGQAAGSQPVIPLWPGGAPGAVPLGGAETVRITDSGEHIVSNVHVPSITVYVPPAAGRASAAVIVIPGGGHQELWMDHEGYRVAEYLAARGIAAFVLKYRLAHAKGSVYTIAGHSLPDVQRAIRLVRSESTQWHIDPQRLGVMGFSAGGELAALAAAASDAGAAEAIDPVDRQSSRPSFQALLYPSISGGLAFSPQSPPAFLLAGNQDYPAISQGLAQLYLEMRRAGARAELHLYEGVGHGFGLRSSNAGPVAAWPQRFVDWLEASNP